MPREIQRHNVFPTPEEIVETVFPIIDSQTYLEAQKIKAETQITVSETNTRASITRTATQGFSLVASDAILANPNLEAVEMNFELQDIQQDGFFNKTSISYRFKGRVDFYKRRQIKIFQN